MYLGASYVYNWKLNYSRIYGLRGTVTDNKLWSVDRPAFFSKKWGQRWVCKRAYELGWKKELFEDFELQCSRGRGRGSDFMERIGKKYQWIICSF